jgi:hypothetical protein
MAYKSSPDWGFGLFMTGCLIAFLAFVGAIVIHADKTEKRDDKRFELCLKSGHQWVDENCVK